MEQIDWMAEIGHKRPTEDRLWHAWKRVILARWNVDKDRSLYRAVRTWEANAKRRGISGLQRRGSEPWFSSWPGWETIVGPRPDEGSLFKTIVGTWQSQNPARTPRAPMSQKLRFRILVRDRFTCRYCGRKSPDVVLHVDHVKPKSKGGTDDPSNLVAACDECNLGKSDTETWAEEGVI